MDPIEPYPILFVTFGMGNISNNKKKLIKHYAALPVEVPFPDDSVEVF
jgi:hypothetical protein